VTISRIVIRHHAYRGKVGYLVSLYDDNPFRQQVFVETRQAAERCKLRFAAHEEITLEDMGDNT
jgi:hypothetical protein